MADEPKKVTQIPSSNGPQPAQQNNDPPVVLIPKCPHCGGELKGFNVTEMGLPTPHGIMSFIIVVCPYPECQVAMGFNFIGYRQGQPGAGLWTPPGGRA